MELIDNLTPHRPLEVSSFYFLLDLAEVEMIHVVAAGLMSIIAHSREVSEGVLSDVFCFDAANYHMGNTLSDYYGSVNNFDMEYELCCNGLRDLILNQGAMLEQYNMSCSAISNMFYTASPGVLQLYIQEGSALNERGSYSAVLEEIAYHENLMGNIKIHTEHYGPPLPEEEWPF